MALFSSKPSSRTSGNAFIYVLIGVVLLAALTFVIMKNQDNSPSSEISAGQVKTAVTGILSYEAQARSAIDNMMTSGTDVANIDFTLPSDAAFNTAPTINKLFHPDGGGLQYKLLPKGGISQAVSQGFYIGRFNNYAWTPTSAQDVIFTAYGINSQTCAKLNLAITGSSTIPTSSLLRTVLIDAAQQASAYANADMLTSTCPSCDQKAAICFSYTGTGTTYAYYSILVAR